VDTNFITLIEFGTFAKYQSPQQLTA